MSQSMTVVRCAGCQMYQVEIKKKAKKWQCKVCGAKQSLMQIFFEGTGKECRIQVQHLNYLKATGEEEKNCSTNFQISSFSNEYHQNENQNRNFVNESNPLKRQRNVSESNEFDFYESNDSSIIMEKESIDFNEKNQNIKRCKFDAIDDDNIFFDVFNDDDNDSSDDFNGDRKCEEKSQNDRNSMKKEEQIGESIFSELLSDFESENENKNNEIENEIANHFENEFANEIEFENKNKIRETVSANGKIEFNDSLFESENNIDVSLDF